MVSSLVYNRAIQDLLEQGDPYKAAKVVKMRDNWLFDIGAVERQPERVELSGADDWRAYIESADDD